MLLASRFYDEVMKTTKIESPTADQAPNTRVTRLIKALNVLFSVPFSEVSSGIGWGGSFLRCLKDS